jgi:hypothetical protein
MTSLVPTADKKATGRMTADWSRDLATKMLTVGNLKLCVEHEAERESISRKYALVYAGLNSTRRVYMRI